MVDRTDIDALLIGALYGELTPADEARLMAHLESHPADRTALDDLTRTRAAVRDSRILAFQAEPPQSISALLLQEASRRAPRMVDHSETATWFQRFVRSFMAHPAMAAAATLVLVIAAAGTLYLRGTDQFAPTAAPVLESARPQSPAPQSPAAEPPAPAAAAPADDPAGAPGAGAATGHAAGDSIGNLSGAGAGSSAEPARFDDSAAAKGQAVDGRAVELRSESRDPSGALDNGRERAERVRPPSKAGAYDGGDLRKLRVIEEAPKADKPKAVRGIELRPPQLAPKELKDSEKESDDEKLTARRRASADDNGRAAGESTRDARNAAAIGGGAAAAAPAAPPPPPAAAPAPSRTAGPAGAADSDLVRDLPQAQTAPSNNAKPPAAKPALNQQTLSSANSAQNAQNERRLDKAANAAGTANTNADASRPAQLLDWARKQREQVISLVNANRCREAASAAVEIYNRAPEYFNANVATDRQIKPCLAYVNDQRDRAERSRATKNAADVQAPAQAAPTRK